MALRSRQPSLRVLLLGGTSEASALAERLAGDGRFSATLSLAGVTRTPVLPRIECRIGGFGGVEGLRAWLAAEGIDVLVDATHPFAVQMSRHASLAARQAGIARLRLERPAWKAQSGDRWTCVAHAEAAAASLGSVPRRALLTVGSKALGAFAAAPMHHYVIRCIDPPDRAMLPPRCEILLARGPFNLEAETALLAGRGIEVVVSKNSGGTATAPKLEAARNLGLEVVLIDRPAEVADGYSVSNSADAMRWLEHYAASPGSRRDA